MHTHEIEVDTSRQAFVDLSVELGRFCAGQGDGLVNVFVPHATAALALMELGSGSETDLQAILDRCCHESFRTCTPTARPDTVPTICCRR